MRAPIRSTGSAIGLATAALLAAACGGSPHKDTTPGGAAAGDSTAAAQRAVEAWRQAYEADSYDAIAKLYAHEKGTVLVEQGKPFAGWDAASAHLKEMLGHAREIHMKLNDVTVDPVEDDLVVVVAQLDRELSDGTVTTSERGVLTLVLHRDGAGGDWLVVSEHYSYPHGS